MHHRVDHRLENRSLAELRHVSAGRVLVRGHAPVADHEAQGVTYLPVEWARNVLRVDLLAGVHPPAPLADGLDPGVRQPFPRILRREQHAPNGRPERAVPIFLENFGFESATSAGPSARELAYCRQSSGLRLLTPVPRTT